MCSDARHRSLLTVSRSRLQWTFDNNVSVQCVDPWNSRLTPLKGKAPSVTSVETLGMIVPRKVGKFLQDFWAFTCAIKGKMRNANGYRENFMTGLSVQSRQVRLGIVGFNPSGSLYYLIAHKSSTTNENTWQVSPIFKLTWVCDVHLWHENPWQQGKRCLRSFLD